MESKKNDLNKDTETRVKVLEYLSKKKSPYQTVTADNVDTQIDILIQETD